MVLEEDGNTILKAAIFLETRKSNKRQNFDYSRMANDKKIVKAEGMLFWNHKIL